MHDVRSGDKWSGGPDRLQEAPGGTEQHVVTTDVPAHWHLVTADDGHRRAGLLLGASQQRDVTFHSGKAVGADEVQDPHRGMIALSRPLAPMWFI
jgi:hypothetical protein